jgi:hypothetical protein
MRRLFCSILWRLLLKLSLLGFQFLNHLKSSFSLLLLIPQFHCSNLLLTHGWPHNPDRSCPNYKNKCDQASSNPPVSSSNLWGDFKRLRGQRSLWSRSTRRYWRLCNFRHLALGGSSGAQSSEHNPCQSIFELQHSLHFIHTTTINF